MKKELFSIKSAINFLNIFIYDFKNRDSVDFGSRKINIIKKFEDKKTDTQAFVGSCGICYYIFFRGTETKPIRIRDLWTDINFFKKPIPFRNNDKIEWNKIKVHGGFLKAYSSIREKLITFLLDIVDLQDKPVFCTGFSMGGALAELASFDISINCNINPITYLFANPRLGNKYFSETLEEYNPNIFRMKHKYDIITHLPFELMGFKHSGTQIKIHSGEWNPIKIHNFYRYKKGLKKL